MHYCITADLVCLTLCTVSESIAASARLMRSPYRILQRGGGNSGGSNAAAAVSLMGLDKENSRGKSEGCASFRGVNNGAIAALIDRTHLNTVRDDLARGSRLIMCSMLRMAIYYLMCLCRRLS